MHFAQEYKYFKLRHWKQETVYASSSFARERTRDATIYDSETMLLFTRTALSINNI